MIRRPRGVAAAYRAKPSWSGAWRVLAALALALTNPAGGWRWDGARADASLVLTAPEAEAAVAAGAPIRFAWEPLATADAYRVVFNDGERTGPWVERPAWESGSLPPGRYRWRVAARTATGLVWSGERTFQVGGGAAAGELAESQPAAPLARLDLGAG
ncbi:MAG TPA: hypothetical protein VFU81_19655, partial [Thermomicrobiales bacterium]|nr:hypothetical protein [Thermomicrobiales bacterium]